jgi:hypothetical protein
MANRSVVRRYRLRIFWVIGWMFTIAFAKLLWAALLGLLVAVLRRSGRPGCSSRIARLGQLAISLLLDR